VLCVKLFQCFPQGPLPFRVQESMKLLRFQILTATSMKMAVFQDDAPVACLHNYPDDGGSKFLWNVSLYLPDYTVQHPRRQPSSWNCCLFNNTDYKIFSIQPTQQMKQIVLIQT
jgi:hypothetical protein